MANANTLKLPRSVQQAADRADALIKGEVVPEQTVPPVELEVVPKNTDVTTIVEPQKVEVKPEETPKPEPQHTAEYWEHRFKTLQGIQASEKVKTSKLVTDLSQRLTTLEDELKTTQRQVPKKYDLSQYFNKDEIENFGEAQLTTILSTANRVAEESLSKTIATELDRRIAPIKAQLDTNQEEATNTKAEVFWSTFAAAVPNWQAINKDQKFLDWLKVVDPITGYSRQQILTGAEEQGDVSRVITVFRAYQGEANSQQTQREKVAQQRSLPESAPSVSQTNPPQDEPMMTAADIKRFHTAVALGKFRNRPKEQEQMEQRVNAYYMRSS